MVALSGLALVYAAADPSNMKLALFVPGTFLGNSLAPIPYDGTVIYLGNYYSVWVVVILGIAGTVIIEAWNMELLSRILARDATRGFRRHPLTRWMLRMYQKAPFWSLVATCVLPIIPHYPMRVLAVLARYPMWKYQLSIALGRGGRYVWLAALGWVFHIPGTWLAAASIIALLLAVRGARRMNRYEADGVPMSAPDAAERA